MTREELKEYHELQKAADDVKNHIKTCEKELNELEGVSITSDIVSGGDGGRKRYVISGKSKEYSDKKTLLQQRKLYLENLERKIAARSADVEHFIFSIESIRLQRIFILRYIDNLSWFKVADSLGTDSTADGVRMEHDRYLKSISI